MKIHFGQIYIQAGINFSFNHIFQNFISEKVTELVEISSKFLEFFTEDYSLIFNVSAKKELAINEIVGPAVYKKDKDVEYSIFLPYVPIMQQPEPNRSALEHLFEGVYKILGEYDIDVSKLQNNQERLIAEILSSPKMFKESE